MSKTFANKEYGIEAKVMKMTLGYSVTLTDTDANETLPSRRIYKTETEAIAYAKGLVK